MDLTLRSDAPEIMETDCADAADYARVQADLARVNALTRTHAPTLAWFDRHARGLRTLSLLDVACGHGDLLRRIRNWAGRRGVAATLTGLDRHPWSLQAARDATPAAAAIRYVERDVFAWPDAPIFDVIVTSQFVHHLDHADLVRFLAWMEAHAARGWFVADIHRHWLPYRAVGVLGFLFRWHRIVRYDGRISVARAFRPAELRAAAREAGIPEGACNVRWRMPFRITMERWREDA